MNYKGNGLPGIIEAVRQRRWLVLVLRGIAVSVGIGALVLVLSGVAADHYRHNARALMMLRVSAVVGLLATVYFSLIRPLLKRASDLQLARWIEEREPQVSNRFVTALEFAAAGKAVDAAARQGSSITIIDRLKEDANFQAGEVDLDNVVPQSEVWSYASAAVSCVLLLGAVLLWGPAQIHRGVAQLAAPVVSAAAVPVDALSITVKPGTARVPKSSDVEIAATLVNFDAQEVTFYERQPQVEGEPEQQWTGRLMEPAKDVREFQYVIFNIQSSVEYFIESNGVKSDVFKLDAVDVPFVKQIDVTLSFPTYTGMAPKTQEDSGDIAALKGTTARITARVTGNVKAARIVLNNKTKIEMRREKENNFVGSLSVAADASYHIELVSIDNETYNGSNEYDITLLEDRPPVVTFDKPGRDTKATSVEEVFTQVKAEDDYGVASVEMFFSVNGAAEQKVNLQQLQRDQARTLGGAHTFFLEELNLQPGDFVSYYAKARDAASEATSDIYFIEVKPFDRQFSQAQQQGGGGGGGGGGGEDQNALTRRQKEIIAATFRLMKERATPQEQIENYNTVALGQERLRDDAKGLIDRIKRRFGEQFNGQEKYKKLVEHIALAAQEMDGALKGLKARTGRDALPPEQRALQQLSRADAIFRETQVSMGNEGGGGGGGGQQAEELADLFELELDKMKNQYETLRREQQQQGGGGGGGQQGKDEAARKLEELARRQQQQLEQQQRRQQAGARNQSSSGGGGGGGSRQQQELIDEARKQARELERLSRERRDAQMQELSRQLNQAADDMQRAQAAAQGDNQSEAAAQGQRALDRLEQARRRLQQSQQANGSQDVSDLQKRATDAAARQREITKEVEDLARRGQQQQGGASQEAKRRVTERKDALADSLNNLERDAEQAARALGNNQERTKNDLREAANSLRRNRTADRVRQNNRNIEGNNYEAARAGERSIQESLNEVAERLRNAEQNANRSGQGGAEEALDRTRQLADDLESLRRRLGQKGQQQQGQSAQNGQQPGGQQQGQQRGQQQGQQPGQQGQQGQQRGQQSGQQQGQGQGQQGQQRGQQQARNQQQQGRGQQPGGQQPGQQPGQGQQGQQQGQGQRGQQGQQGQQGQGQGGGQEGQQGQQQGQRGQQGQQGQGQRGGQNPQPGEGGQQAGATGGGTPSFVSGGRTAGGGSDAGSDRQLGAELRERMREAEDLRRQLGGSRELDEVIGALRQLGANNGSGGDTQTAAMLRSQVIDPLRALEVLLSQKLQGKQGRQNMRLIDEGSAPERYRKLVEDYYKRLSSRSVVR